MAMATLVVNATVDFRGGATETNIDRIVFNTGPAGAIATFGVGNFGAGLISNTVRFVGDEQALNQVTVEVEDGESIDASGWTFENWEGIANFVGTAGDNTIIGSSQRDIIQPGSGIDILEGRDGDDDFNLFANPAPGASIDGGSNSLGGFDQIAVLLSGAIDLRQVAITRVERTLFAGGNITAQFAGDQIGGATNRISTLRADDDATVALQVFGDGADLRNVNFIGWGADDSIFIRGDLGVNNTLSGSSQDDRIRGGNLHDRMAGGGGTNVLEGGLGNDVYLIESAQDRVVEEVGAGTFDSVFTSVSYSLRAGAEIENFAAATNVDVTKLQLRGNSFTQEIRGNFGNNRLDSGGGADVLVGLSGSDTYISRSGLETVVEATGGGTGDWVATDVSYTLAAAAQVEAFTTTSSGGTAAINLTSNGFGQTIEGNASGQTLSGNGGQDFLIGHAGRDRLFGGAQNDRFIFNALTDSGSSVATADQVLDFRDANGEQDQLDFRNIDANTTLAGDQAFVLDTDGSFSTGEIRQTLVNGGADILLELNVDGDATSEMAILVGGRTVLLDSADLLL
jgi:Ca2+-binding RTX toxin-like protein